MFPPDAAQAIKQSISLAREQLQELKGSAPGFYFLAQASYELCRGLGVPAVKHSAAALESQHLEDAIANFTTVIDIDLTVLKVLEDPEEGVQAAQAISIACHELAFNERLRSVIPGVSL